VKTRKRLVRKKEEKSDREEKEERNAAEGGERRELIFLSLGRKRGRSTSYNLFIGKKKRGMGEKGEQENPRHSNQEKEEKSLSPRSAPSREEKGKRGKGRREKIEDRFFASLRKEEKDSLSPQEEEKEEGRSPEKGMPWIPPTEKKKGG